MKKNRPLSFKIPCGNGHLTLDDEGFYFDGIDGYCFNMRDIEEIAMVINDALNLVDDYLRGENRSPFEVRMDNEGH